MPWIKIMYKAVGYMDYTEMFRARLTQLRLEKGVSARDMSLSLGQSESYINKIENTINIKTIIKSITYEKFT